MRTAAQGDRPLLCFMCGMPIVVWRQGVGLAEELPKNGDVLKSSFFPIAAIVPFGWDDFGSRRRFAPSLSSALELYAPPCATGPLAIGPINRSIREERHVQVLVRDNNVDQALRVLKKKMQREGVFREMKLRRHYEKPSERRVREKAEAIRGARKLARKKLQREGLLPMKPRVSQGAPEEAIPRAHLASDLATT